MLYYITSQPLSVQSVGAAHALWRLGHIGWPSGGSNSGETTMRMIKLGLILPLLAACQQQAAPQETGGGLNLDPAMASQVVTYACGEGQPLTVSYDQGGLAHMTLNGSEVWMTARGAQRGIEYSDGRVSWRLVNEDNKDVGTLTQADGEALQCTRVANTAAPAPTLTACRADQLEMETGEMDAGMGHRHLPVTLKVKGATGCLLPKWPELRPVQDQTSALKVQRTTDSYFASVKGKDRIELKAGDTARFFIGWSVIPNEAQGKTVCPKVRGWNVYAPGGGALPTIPADIEACGGKVTLSAFTDAAEGGNTPPKAP